MENTGIDNSHGILRGNYRVQMYYEDTDFSGYVYHANYLKFFERAREYVFGASYLKQLFQENFHFVVASADLSFKKPATYGDIVEVISTAPFTDSPIIDFKQDAYIAGDLEKPIVTSDIRLVSVDHHGKPVRIPPEVKKHLLELSERPNE